MRTLQQFLTTIRSILGLSNSIRSTSGGIKREVSNYSSKKKSRQQPSETNQVTQ